MTLSYAHGDPHQLGALQETTWRGPAPKRIVTGFGFWIFLLSDIVMFSTLFATYAVLLKQTAGGPSGSEIFDLRNVAAETALLLLSSFTCGLASIAADLRHMKWYQAAMSVTCLFGLGFLALEAREFSDLVSRGAGPTRSAFLSAFSPWSAATACTSLPASSGS